MIINDGPDACKPRAQRARYLVAYSLDTMHFWPQTGRLVLSAGAYALFRTAAYVSKLLSHSLACLQQLSGQHVYADFC